MKCKTCGVNEAKKYSYHATGLYCSRSCANKRVVTEETKEKMRLKAKQQWKNHRASMSLGDRHSKLVGNETKGKFNKDPKSLCELSTRTVRKIFKRMSLPCSHCGWNEDVCDIHHIYGKKIDDANNHSNLTYLCPNCHRLAGSKKLTPQSLINLQLYIGDRWKEYYYG